jgi:hypothetical protein
MMEEEKIFEKLEEIKLPTRKDYEEALAYLDELEEKLPEEAEKIKKVRDFVKLSEVLVGGE